MTNLQLIYIMLAALAGSLLHLILLGVLGGFGVNAGVTALRQKFQLKKLKAAYPDWKTKLG